MLEPKQTSVPARKNRKDFLAGSNSIANIKGARSCEETKQKGIREMHRKVYLFKNEKSP